MPMDAVSDEARQVMERNPHGAGSTKAKQFSAKVSAIQEMNTRLQEKNSDLPTGKDFSIALKYFYNSLLGWVKESKPCFLQEECCFNRSGYPSVDYELLYDALLVTLQLSNNVESDAEEFKEIVLKTLSALVPFLPMVTLMASPTTLAEIMFDVSPQLRFDLMELVTGYILPLLFQFMTKDLDDESSEIHLHVPAILATVLDSCTEPGLWARVMECMMRFKRNVSSDLLTVLAYGSQESLEAAIHLLNRYFPPVDVSSVKAYQSPPYEVPQNHYCQSLMCVKLQEKNLAVKVCLDPSFCSSLLGVPPPLYLCQKCFDLFSEHAGMLTMDVLQPVTLVSEVCDNPDCRFGFMKALYFCFSVECARVNEGKPIRLCEDCHKRLHGNLTKPHMNHHCLKELWETDDPERTYLVDSMVRLWGQAEPDFPEKYTAMGLEIDPAFRVSETITDPHMHFKKVFRSFHGLWLLKLTCPLPPSCYHLEHATRLLAMLFVWVEAIDYANHHKVVQVVKQSRQQAISWMQKMLQYDLNTFRSCLVPLPPLSARAAHPWDMLTSVVRRNLEILQRIVTLVKHGLVPEEVWEFIMPVWLEEIKTTTPVDEMKGFAVVIKSLFDKHSPVRPEYAVNFIKHRLISLMTKQTQEGLVWVQIISYLNVELDVMFLVEAFIEMILVKEECEVESENFSENFSTDSVFPFPDKLMLERVSSAGLSTQESVNAVATPASSSLASGLPSLTNVNNSLSAAILILDILIKQLTLLKSSNDGKLVLTERLRIGLNLLMVCLLDQPYTDEHSDHETESCHLCQILNVIYYQVKLLLDLTIFMPVLKDQDNADFRSSVMSRKVSSSSTVRSRSSIASQGKVSSISKPGLGQASSEEEAKLNNGVTAADENHITGLRKHLRNLPPEISMEERLLISRKISSMANSVLNSIPELQIMNSLLKELAGEHEATVSTHILHCLHILCLRGKCLQMVAKEDLELLERIQRTLFIPSLWQLLEAANSYVSQLVVPLILHGACLQFGADRLCECMEDQFTDADWKVRFAAVEKIGLLCQFLIPDNLKDSHRAQSAIVHAFAFLTSAIEDLNQAVSERARSMLQAVQEKSLRTIFAYMEEHFERVAGDRLMILRMFQMVHITNANVSPFTGVLFVNLLALARKWHDKDVLVRHGQARRQTKEQAQKESLLPMCARSLSTRRLLGRQTSRIDSAPIEFYRNFMTLRSALPRRHNVGRKVRSESRGPGRIPTIDLTNPVELALDSVAEEDSELEGSMLASSRAIASELHDENGEVLSLLISIIFEYLSKVKGAPDHKYIQGLAKQIGALMGIPQYGTSGQFSVSDVDPSKLRENVSFVSYIMGIPQLLDENVEIGSDFLPLTLAAMEACVKDETYENGVTEKRIALFWLPHPLRQAWLMTLIIVLYKYAVREMDMDVLGLVQIAKHTLDGHGSHSCSAEQRLIQNQRKLSPPSMAAPSKPSKLSKGGKQFTIMSFGTKKSASALAETESDRDMIQLTDIMYADTDVQFGKSGGTFSACSPDVPGRDTESKMLDIKLTECLLCGQNYVDAVDGSTLKLCIVALATYVHMDTQAAAPIVIDLLHSVARHCVDGDVVDMAQQFMRCVLVQLCGNRIFPELFRERAKDDKFYSTLAVVLQDFPRISQVDPIRYVLEDLIETPSSDRVVVLVSNLCAYVKIVAHIPNLTWAPLQGTFDDFFRALPGIFPASEDMDDVLEMMAILLKTHKQVFKESIQSIEEVMTFSIKRGVFSVGKLHSLCKECMEAFTRERDQIMLLRQICSLLSLALKCKLSLPDRSLQNLILYICYDSETDFHFDRHTAPSKEDALLFQSSFRALECLEHNFLPDLVEFMRKSTVRLKENQDTILDKSPTGTFSQLVKLAVSQLIAAHLWKFTRESRESRENRLCQKFTGWLRSPPDVHSQLGSDDLNDYLVNMRILCWVLLGGLSHKVETQPRMSAQESDILHPVPLTEMTHVSDFIERILNNVVEEEKLHRRTVKQLSYSFALAQIWTVYCEQHLAQTSLSNDLSPVNIAVELWSRLTPVVYKLLQVDSSQMLTHCVHHFASMVENVAVMCPVTFSQLLPLWLPTLQLYANQIPSAISQKINENISRNASLAAAGEAVDRLGHWIHHMRATLSTGEHKSMAQKDSGSLA